MKFFPAVRLPLVALIGFWVGLALPRDLQADPSVTFTVVPAATGKQLVRTSIPLPRGFLGTNQALVVRSGHGPEPVGLRVLSWYPVDQRGAPHRPPRARDLPP